MAPITYTYFLLFTLSIGTGTHSLKKDHGLPVKNVTASTTERQTAGPLALQSPRNHLQKRDINTGNILQGPRNRTVFEGSSVNFTCTGNAAVDDIVWNINNFRNISTHIDSGLTVSTLFMVAHLQYNGTVIWCSAVCGGELCGRSGNATLTVRRSSITQGPQNQTQFEGSLVAFSCEGSVDDFTWHITGPAQYSSISSRPTESGLTVSTMVLTAHREYNLSRVRCEAICGGELCGRSEEAVLTVISSILQGLDDRTVSQGSVVTFSCVGDTSVDDLIWQTEGPGQYINITTYRESGLLASNLLMTAHPGYNQTTVSCTAICGSEFCGTSVAKLQVQCKDKSRASLTNDCVVVVIGGNRDEE